MNSRELLKRELEYVLFDKRTRKPVKTRRRVLTVTDVTKFLQLAAAGHRWLYQYTNLDSLRKMWESKKLYLTLAQHLNDQIEYTACDPMKWKTCYLACFSFGSVENMGMWKMYGRKATDSIRLAFPGRELRDAIKKVVKAHSVYLPGEGKNGIVDYKTWKQPNLDISFHDVIYEYGRHYEIEDSNGNHRHRLGTMLWNRKMALEKSCHVFDNYRDYPEFATYVKDVIWAYENETRLVIQSEKVDPQPPKIAIDISKVLERVTVQLGPNFVGGIERIHREVGYELPVEPSRYRVRDTNS